MIESVLIANRGEIARRIMVTARRLGIRTVAVFSTADAESPHVREADAAICIGAPSPQESYLRTDRILAAAAAQDVQAIHPGYGFLSENADFADAVVAAGRVWVGAPSTAIRAMGRKDAAKRMMADAGVPVTPGYLGDDQNPARLAREAAALGWPVLIKAVAGGGGKGMRKVDGPGEFSEALASATREAIAAFGDGRVLLETYVRRPRHIEVQVFGDAHGNVVHLFERDCSIQRRHQKLIEEAPAPGMDRKTRQALCAAAVRAARAVNYQGAGTVEFIADASDGLRADRIWFMEMNTRLQVEHPVTEAVTGLDLVEWQFRVASGLPLSRSQEEIALRGHAIEARLCAEDPVTGFLPSTGPLSVFELPKGVRSDSAAEPGFGITLDYDPLLAKLIAHGDTREDAARALAAACQETCVWPVKSNAWFLARCLDDPEFLEGGVDTGFVERRGADLSSEPEPSRQATAISVAAFVLEDNVTIRGASGPWSGGLFGFQANRSAGSTSRFYRSAASVDAILEPSGSGGADVQVTFSADGAPLVVRREGERYTCDGLSLRVHANGDAERIVFEGGAAFPLSRTRPPRIGVDAISDGAVRSPMPGRIVAVMTKPGATVRKGQVLVALEAMKMEHSLLAPFDATVLEVSVGRGDQVTEGALMVRLGPEAER